MLNLQIPKKTFFGAAIGTLVEYYDYALFSTFLPLLAPLFFPADTVYHSLVKGYFILFITMLVRPLGGLLFGYIGDMLGRRVALLTSMYGIAIATLVISITPTYFSWGIAASIILVGAKAIQICCFGGEFNGAGIYVVEHARNKNEALTGSLLLAITLSGALIASFIGIIITRPGMPDWSWRIAFALGGIIGIFGIIYRKNLIETPNFENANLKHHGLGNMVKTYPRELLTGIFLGGFATVPFATAITFINPILMTKGVFTTHQLMTVQTLLEFFGILVLIPVGLIADKFTPRKVIQLSSWALIIFSYPLLMMIDTGHVATIIMALSLLIMINEFFLGPTNAYLKNLFAMQYRYRASSLSFCVGMSLFGGLTPVVENYLYQLTGHFYSLTAWLVLIGAGTLLTTMHANLKDETINEVIHANTSTATNI